MKFRLLAPLALAFALSGCGTLSGLVSPDTKLDAMKAAETVIAGYADIYQPLVLTYGRLPKCEPGSPPVCHDVKIFGMLKAIDKAATAAIVAAQPVLDGSMPDTGQITAVVTAIQAAELQINSSHISESN